MENVRKNSPRAWLLAARPKTLAAAVMPVCVASSIASANGCFRLAPAGACFAFALLMQVAANFINDLFDFLKGTDGDGRIGPERACAQGWVSPRAMRIGIGVVLAAACVCALPLLLTGNTAQGNPRTMQDFLSGMPESLSSIPEFLNTGLLWTGAACVVFAFLYTTLLSYCGLGDVLVWMFFGFVPVAGTYYVQAGSLVPEVWWAGAACGLVVDTLLVLNNYRDRDTDRAAGKRTLVVVLGGKFGSLFYLLQGVAGTVCIALAACRGHMWAAILPMFYLLPHFLTWRKMTSIGRGRELNRVLGFTARNILTFGALAALSFLLN